MALRYAGVEQINFMIVVDKPDVDKACLLYTSDAADEL